MLALVRELRGRTLPKKDPKIILAAMRTAEVRRIVAAQSARRQPQGYRRQNA
jgi:hypothetical protein